MAFIGGMAVQRKSAEQIITRCKALNLKMVAGGPLFTSEPDEFKAVDHHKCAKKLLPAGPDTAEGTEGA